MLDSLLLLHSQLSACRRCAQAGHNMMPPPIFSGPNTARIMVVGQAPGRHEVQQTGLPFSGSAGQRLFRWLAQAGWDEETFRSQHYMTAVAKCFPGNNAQGRGDRVPSPAELELCRPWLERELALVQPRAVVVVGGLAIRRFLGNKVKLAQVVGEAFRRPNADHLLTSWARDHLPDDACVVPWPHPSGASQWINRPEHQELLQQAIAQLARFR